MNDIKIKWQNGKAVIHLDGFFPCSQKQFIKLLKIIDLDHENKEKILEKLKVYFQKRIDENNSNFESYGKEYWHYRQLASDARNAVETRKHPNGVYLSYYELMEMKHQLKTSTESYQKYEKLGRKCKRENKSFNWCLDHMK